MLNIKNKIQFNINYQEHPYFLVTPSIIPFLTSISALFFVTEIVNYFYFFSKPFTLILSFLTLSFILFEWFFNVALESDYHTKAVQYNNKVAFMLFITTEVMFFFSLFWTFFHGSLSPSIVFDNTWPPKGISVINAFGPPIWGTWVLWMSSIYALYIKDLMLSNFIKNFKQILWSFNILLALAALFTVCQLFEFYLATFSFREGLYGSIFYLLTGFHGIHVVIGTIFLMVCCVRFHLLLNKENIFYKSYIKNVILNFYDSYSFFFGYFKDPILSKNNPKRLNKPSKNLELQNNSVISRALLFQDCLILKNSSNKKTVKNALWWQPYHFSGLETSIWYWQFVDIVWIFVWIIIYVWGNNSLPFSVKLELHSF